MLIDRILPTDKDVDTLVQRVYKIDPNASVATFNRIKQQFLAANPSLIDPSTVPVGHPVAVPDVDNVQTTSSGAISPLSGLALAALSPIAENLRQTVDQLVNTMKAQQNAIHDPGVLKNVLPADLQTAKSVLLERTKRNAAQITSLEQSTTQLLQTLESVISGLSQ